MIEPLPDSWETDLFGRADREFTRKINELIKAHNKQQEAIINALEWLFDQYPDADSKIYVQDELKKVFDPTYETMHDKLKKLNKTLDDNIKAKHTYDCCSICVALGKKPGDVY